MNISSSSCTRTPTTTTTTTSSIKTTATNTTTETSCVWNLIERANLYKLQYYSSIWNLKHWCGCCLPLSVLMCCVCLSSSADSLCRWRSPWTPLCSTWRRWDTKCCRRDKSERAPPSTASWDVGWEMYHFICKDYFNTEQQYITQTQEIHHKMQL